MIQSTKNNFCHFGYNQFSLKSRKQPSDQFCVSYEPCSRPSLKWGAECVLAAQDIHSWGKSDIRVCMSGGVDSEIVAKSFRSLGVKFRASILRMNNDLNVHDIVWAVKYCEQHQVPYDFVDLNVTDFLASDEIKYLAKSTNCISPGILIQVKLMELLCQQGLVPVIGAGDIVLDLNNDKWQIKHVENYWASFFLQQKKKMVAVPRFFHWTPELVHSFLIDPLITGLIQKKFPRVKNYRSFKPTILGQHFFLEPRPKYYGHEKFPEQIALVTKQLKELTNGVNEKIFLDPVAVITDLEKIVPTKRQRHN